MLKYQGFKLICTLKNNFLNLIYVLYKEYLITGNNGAVY